MLEPHCFMVTLTHIDPFHIHSCCKVMGRGKGEESRGEGREEEGREGGREE